jgi:DnaJ domain
VLARFDASTRAPLAVEEGTLQSGLVYYLMLLQVPQTAKQCEIKTAYHQLQKMYHPDILGPEAGNDMSILLNQVRSARERAPRCRPSRAAPP